MKLVAGLLCIVLAVVCAIVAATTYHFAAGAAVLGLALVLLGVGLVAEATDPRRKPNPRTRCPRDSDWCDGVVCRDYGYDCPNAAPHG